MNEDVINGELQILANEEIEARVEFLFEEFMDAMLAEHNMMMYAAYSYENF